MKSIRFSSSVPVFGVYDVVVIGGGPAGVCAAIASARKGIRVLLVEATGTLGGMATSALVGPFMTNYDRDGERPTVGGMRCMPAAMAMGQAAGTAAAMAILENVSIREIDVGKLQADLRSQNAILD